MNKVISIGLVLGAALSLIGCGEGSSDSKKVTKVIVDDPIVGLNYECTPSGKKEKTNEKGEFTCNVGDRVEFSIGKYVIGSTDTSSGTADTLRIIDLIEDEAKVTDVRQILQTIDSDDDGVIVIPEGFDKLDDLDAELGATDFDEQVEGLLDGLVTGEDADKHAEETYQKYLLARKTFFFVSHKYAYPSVIEVRFNSDLSKAAFYKDTKSTGENILEINGTQITQLDNNSSKPSTIFTASEKDGNILIEAEREGKKFDAILYDTLDEAKNQFDAETATTPLTEEMLEGKIFYKSWVDDEKKVYQAAKYNFPNVSKIDKKECACDEHGWIMDSYKQTVAIEDGKLKVTTNHHGIYYISLHEVEDDAWNVFYEADKDSDGVIDKRGTQIWYTVKPENFPEFPAFSSGGGGGSGTDTSLSTLLAGNTFYVISHDGMTKAVFTADFAQVITTDYNADGTTKGSPETDDVETDEDKLIINEGGGYLKFKSRTGEYLLFDNYTSAGEKTEEVRAYFDRTKAEAYLDSLGGGASSPEGKLIDVLGGKTFYIPMIITGSDGEPKYFLSTLEMNNDLTGAIFEDGNTNETFQYDLNIQGDVLYLDENNTLEIVKYVENKKVVLKIRYLGSKPYERTYYIDKKEAEKELAVWKEHRTITEVKIRKAIVGKTLYGVFAYGADEKELVTVQFATNGIATRKVEEGSDTSKLSYEYSIIDSKIIIIEDGHKTSDVEVLYISDTEVRIQDNGKAIGYQFEKYFYSKSMAESRPNIYYDASAEEGKDSDNGLDESSGITLEMLEGKVFYMKYVGDHNTEYMRVEFVDGQYTGARIDIDNASGDVIKDESASFSFTILDGKIRVDIAKNNHYGWWKLTSKSDTQWNLQVSIDEGKDGTIDRTLSDTWYLSKPSDFPSKL